MNGHRKADIELDKLLVNPKNYRFPSVKNEHQAMLTMLDLQQSKLTRLAEDIAKHGLNPTKRFPV